jgi:hypothetical protein
VLLAAAALALTLNIDAPSSLASAAERVRAIDQQTLEGAVRAAGLEPPAVADVVLVPETDPAAQRAPEWMIGFAHGTRLIVIFPQRVTRYPYDSLESVVRHEVVHLALTARAGGRTLPRWFHEGVATSVEAGWGVTDQVRLIVAAVMGPTADDVNELFRSDAQSELGYLLSTALVDNLRERHGADVPGRIATRVAAGAPFSDAFRRETGEAPDTAAATAWRSYRAWNRWVPALASASAIWSFILVLTVFAFIARRRRRLRLRERWSDEERHSWPFDA